MTVNFDRLGHRKMKCLIGCFTHTVVRLHPDGSLRATECVAGIFHTEEDCSVDDGVISFRLLTFPVYLTLEEIV